MFTIDKGDYLSPRTPFWEVDESDYIELFAIKGSYIREHVDVSVRAIINAAEEAKEVYEKIGFSSPEQMITEGYDLDMREIEHAKAWLKLSGNDDQPFKEAVAAAEAVGEMPTAGAPQGNNNASKAVDAAEAAGALATHGVNNCNNVTIDSVGQSRGNNPTYTCRRLMRDRPDLFERVKAGELSPNAAAIEAGFRKKQISVPVGDVEAVVRRLTKHYTLEEITEAWTKSH